jgi:hypothetical protein
MVHNIIPRELIRHLEWKPGDSIEERDMKTKIYLETTIPSYLTAWPSRDLITAANQQTTRDWWAFRRAAFEVYISQLVIQEASMGDPEAANRHLEAIKDIPELDITDAAKLLAKELIAEVPLPAKAELDALHIAIAAVNDMEYVLTWNCTHIANAVFRHHIEAICRSAGYEPPVICTPQELMEV